MSAIELKPPSIRIFITSTIAYAIYPIVWLCPSFGEWYCNTAAKWIVDGISILETNE